MSAEEEHTAVLIKDVLRAVAVMHVPIDDEHLVRAVFALGVAGADTDAVEQAEAHALIRSGVMAWRAHSAKSVVHLARHDRIHRVHHTTDGAQGDVEGAGADDRVTGAQLMSAR